MSDFSSPILRTNSKFASLFLRSNNNSQPSLPTQMESANINLMDIIANLTNQHNEGNPSSPIQKNINYEMLANIASVCFLISSYPHNYFLFFSYIIL